MAQPLYTYATLVLVLVHLITAQQQCYFGPGAKNRGPSSLVPCLNTGQSACCLLGDVCLSGNTCWNYVTGNLYQYGCTDISYKDKSCPYKCGFNSSTISLLSLLMEDANRIQLYRHGQPSSTVSTTLVLTTLGYATLQRAVGANGVPVRICSYCNLDNVRTWAQTLESLFTLHPYSRPTCLYLPASVEVRAISLQQE